MALFQTPKLGIAETEVLRQVAELWDRQKFMRDHKPGRWYGLLRQSALARGIRGSNSIEGLLVSPDDAAAAVENDQPFDAANAQDEAWLAVIGYRDAMTHAMRQGADPDASIDVSLIRSLHFMMMSHNLGKNPGTWRPGSIYVRDDAKNETVYEGPPAEVVAPLMSELVDSLNSVATRSEKASVHAAMAHLNLVMIHPFSDGNGRMARCLQTLVLSRAKVFDPVFCSVEEWLGCNTPEYYKVLADVGGGSWQPQRDARPWIRFMIKAHYQQALTVQRRQSELSQVWTEIEEQCKELKLAERVVAPLVEASYGRAIRNSRYRYHTDVTNWTASRDLAALVDAGFLEPQGEKRARFYRRTPKLAAIRDKFREKKPLPDPFEGVRA